MSDKPETDYEHYERSYRIISAMSDDELASYFKEWREKCEELRGILLALFDPEGK